MRTLSAGDVLRAQIRARTPIGRQAEEVVSKGGELPGRLAFWMLSLERAPVLGMASEDLLGLKELELMRSS